MARVTKPVSLSSRQDVPQKKTPAGRRLLLAVSLGAVSAMLPGAFGVYGGRARAQVFPTGCTDAVTTGTPNDADGNADAGETITCLSPPSPIGSVTGNVGDLTVVVGSATTPTSIVATGGDDIGIALNNGGSVQVLNASSSVYGEDHAVLLDNFSSGTADLELVSEGSLSSDSDAAVRATNLVGNTSITVNDVNSNSGEGIDVLMGSLANDLTIVATGTIQSNRQGIDVSTSSTGSVDITVMDVVSANNHAVEVGSTAYSNDITITASGSLSGARGAFLNPGGMGDVSLTATDITSTVYEGVVVLSSATSVGDVEIAVSGTVQAATTGISVFNFGSGDTVIDVGTAIGGDVFPQRGIGVVHQSGSGGISISSTGLVSGGDGLTAVQYGTGDVHVSVHDIVGTMNDGINVYHSGAGSIAITATGTVTAVDEAIEIDHTGSGDVTVNVVDVVAGSSIGESAIVALTGATTGTATITATGSVSGGRGIDIYHRGTGALTITAADVTGSSNIGIYTISSSSLLDDINITTQGAVSGAYEGIYSVHVGTGDLIISTESVTGEFDDGIDVEHVGTGSIEISASGPVLGGDDGIDAIVRNGDLTITTSGTVTGVQSGIEGYNYSAGSTTISVSSNVTGETEAGILVVTSNGSSVTIGGDATVTGATDAVVFLGETGTADSGADVLTLEAGASLVGDVLMHAGDDTFNDASGQFTSVVGGDGTDTFNFTGPVRTLTNSGGASDSVRAFEIFNFNEGGITLAGTHTGLSEANFNAGTTVLAGSLEATSAVVATGATLNAADGALFTGMLTNNGILDVGSSPGTFTVDGDLLLGSTGVLPIELGPMSDEVIVTGDVTLGGTLDVSFPEGRPIGVSTYRFIDGDGLVNGAFDQQPSSNGLLVQSEVNVDQATSDVSFTSTVLLPSTLDDLSDKQEDLGDNLFLAQTSAGSEELTDLVEAIGEKETEQEIAAALEDLSPEAADMGLRLMLDAQNGFTQAMLSANAVPAASDERYTIWGDFEFGRVDQSDGSDLEFDGGRLSFFTGINMTLSSGLTFGLAGGVTTFDAEADDLFGGLALGDETDGEVFHVGGGIRKEIGNGRLDIVSSHTTGQQDFTMRLVDPSTDGRLSQSAEVDLSVTDVAARFGLERWGERDLPVQPFVELGTEFIRQDSFVIGQTLPSGLDVEEIDANRSRVRLGTDLAYALKERLVATGRIAGVQYFGDTENAFVSRFVSAPSSDNFTITGNDVERQLELAGNLAYRLKSGVEFKVEASSSFGDLTAYGAEFQISKRF